MTSQRVVVVGAGIVGCGLADQLTELGATDVTVLEQGALWGVDAEPAQWAAGGSTSHAPGLVFQCNSSKTLAGFARYTVETLLALHLDGQACFDQVGSLEVAARPDRVRELYRRRNWLSSWGIDRARVITPAEAAALNPVIDPTAIAAALYVPTDGVAHGVRACQALGRRAMSRGATFRDRTTVTGLLTEDTAAGPRVSGVTTDAGDIPADVVVMAGGLWAPELAGLLGTRAPLQAVAHQLAWTTPLPAFQGATAQIATPIVRWQEQDLYYRQRGDQLGIGWYGHDPKPVWSTDLPRQDDAAVMPSVLPFTAADFDPAWQRSLALVPDLADATIADAMDGIFSFTTDGAPLLGPVPEVAGLWAAEAVWVTHSMGVARAVAQWVVHGRPVADVHECDVARFEAHQHAPAYVRARGEQNYVEVYDLLHPLQPMEHPRPLRTTAYRPSQVALGAVFTEAAGWERPQWYEANADLVDSSGTIARDDWSARYWSPIAAAEATRTREGVALFDMSALTRIDVMGRGATALLLDVTTGRVDRSVGTVTYCLLLDEQGGILSDVTVARLGRDHYQVGGNGQLDVALLRRSAQARGDVVVVDATPGTVCLGIWGPRARDVVQPLTSLDLSNAGLGYFRAARTQLGLVPVTLLRVSYVGELGWEVYAGADMAEKLWDTLWQAGERHGLIAAGRAAFTSLRLEKGYRSYGTDMTGEHTPAEAGLAWALRKGGGYRGAQAVVARGEPTRRLVTLRLHRDDVVPMGNEPVLAAAGAPGDRALGYVTSAAYGHTVGHPVALAWVAAAQAAPGTALCVNWFDETLPATVVPDVLHDPDMTRLRS